MLNIPRADYPLKTEVQFVFSRNNIDENMLNFLDDLNLTELHKAKRLEVTLVDHNVVAVCLECVNDAVVQVIDHHKWEASFCSPVNKTIEMVGSCATLVADKLLEQHRELLDEIVARLLISAILVDTLNFNSSAKKATPKDVEVFQELLTYLPSVDWAKEYAEIKKAKAAVSWMAVRDLLRKDLKVVKVNDLTVAISSVPISLNKLTEMPNFKVDLDHVRHQQKATAVVVMTTTTKADGGVHRGMVIFAEDESFRSSLIDYLKNFNQPSLELYSLDPSSVYSNEHPNVHFFVQNNTAASRKVVLPAVRTFIQSYTPRI